MQSSNRSNCNAIAAAIPIAALRDPDVAYPASKINKIRPEQLQQWRTACIFNVHNPPNCLGNRANLKFIQIAVQSLILLSALSFSLLISLLLCLIPELQ